MLFNSYIFIFAFLPIVLFVYFLLNHKRLVLAAKSWLFGSSLLFYSWWTISYLPLLLASILINYTIATQMMYCEGQRKPGVYKKSLLIIGLFFNVALLCYFKYMDFFISNLNFITGSNIQLLHIAFPLAISFFTIQQVAFLVDVYEGLTEERSFIDYALFVSFFPHLIAGPIVRHKEIMPQHNDLRNKIFSFNNFSLGVFIFSLGLFKKVVIADTFALTANRGFDEAQLLTFVEAWATSLSYTFQLYFDFSGYSDMAMGTALMFNINLPANFKSPYQSTSIIDFWKRWHITLTNFITVYIYSAILRAAKRVTLTKSMVAIFIAMFVSGLWHGAAWTYVIWGIMHGSALIINHTWRKLKIKMPKFMGWLITFNFINISFIIFRSREWKDFLKVLEGMMGLNGIIIPTFEGMKSPTIRQFLVQFKPMFYNIASYMKEIVTLVFMLIVFGLIALIAKNSIQIKENFAPNIKYGVWLSFMIAISLLFVSRQVDFIYFNF